MRIYNNQTVLLASIVFEKQCVSSLVILLLVTKKRKKLNKVLWSVLHIHDNDMTLAEYTSTILNVNQEID